MLGGRRRGRRQQVVLRSKVAGRRKRVFARLFIIAAAGGTIFIGIKRHDLVARVARLTAPMLTVSSVDASGVPERARGEVDKALKPWVGRAVGPFEMSRLEKQLRERFGWLDRLRLSRSWAAHAVRAEAALKQPVAQTTDRRWLGSDGALFQTPEGLYAARLPVLAAPKQAVDLRPLVAFLAEFGPKLKITGAEYSGAEEGWTFWNADGLRLRWGDLARGPEKLEKLSKVLDDARGRFGAVQSADLRFFADGRVLVEPKNLGRAR
jgi:hypothetical protein